MDNVNDLLKLGAKDSEEVRRQKTAEILADYDKLFELFRLRGGDRWMYCVTADADRWGLGPEVNRFRAILETKAHRAGWTTFKGKEFWNAIQPFCLLQHQSKQQRERWGPVAPWKQLWHHCDRSGEQRLAQLWDYVLVTVQAVRTMIAMPVEMMEQHLPQDWLENPLELPEPERPVPPRQAAPAAAETQSAQAAGVPPPPPKGRPAVPPIPASHNMKMIHKAQKYKKNQHI